MFQFPWVGIGLACVLGSSSELTALTKRPESGNVGFNVVRYLIFPIFHPTWAIFVSERTAFVGSRGGAVAVAAMEGFFNALKSSGIADAVKDMAMDALHLNDDKKGSVTLIMHFISSFDVEVRCVKLVIR